MKKISLILIMLIGFTSAVLADEWVNFNARGESAPIYEVTNSTCSFVEFGLEIPGMNGKDIDNFNRVYIPEHTRMDSTGFPEVPVVTYLIAIPECDNVNLNVTLLDSTTIENMNIYPTPDLIEVQNGDITYMEEQFSINDAAYNTDAYFPGYTGELVEKGAVRAQHCIRVKIYPVQFNPVQQKVIAYSRLNIEMTFENATGSVNEDVGIFNEVCGSAMINYNSNGLNASVSCGAGYIDPGDVQWVETFADCPDGKYIAENCDYLIITHDEFWENQDLQNLANKRANYNGFDVVIVKMIDVEEQVITPNDWSYEKLRLLIRNTYNQERAEHTYDNRLGYVNLFGDNKFYDENGNPVGDCVPTYQAGYDVYFSQLTEIGGIRDVYPDILLGRCSVDSTDQVANVCQKIVDYEPIDVNDPEYDGCKDRMTFLVGEPSNSHVQDGIEIIDPIVESYYTTLLTEESYPFTQTNYDSIILDNSESMALDKYDEGNLIYTYMGHGGHGSWGWANGHLTYSDISDSSFNNNLPLIFSIACNTGAFHNHDDCMAEEFLVCDSIKGAIGFIGGSVSIDWTDNHGFAPFLFDAVCSYSLGMCSEIILEAKLKTSRMEAIDQMNYFGDPALNILMDNKNTGQCDLQCSHQGIEPNNINNQTLQILAGVSNYSQVDLENDFDVICYLADNSFGNSDSIIHTISNIDARETISVDFNFDISSSMPTGYTILVKADPDSVIAERNEDNKEVEKGYDFYRPQDGFPSIYNKEEGYIINIPLFNNNHIIIGGMEISSSGDLIWDSNLQTSGLALPIYNYHGDFDYIIRSLNRRKVYKINGFTGDSIWVYNVPSNTFMNYCLGDINNNGIQELIITFSNGSTQNKIIILDLDGNILLEKEVEQVIIDLAVGDYNNDGYDDIAAGGTGYYASGLNDCWCGKVYVYAGNALLEEADPNIATDEEQRTLAVPELIAYPNPFKNQIEFEIKADHINDLKLQIYNIKGQLIKSINVQERNFIWQPKERTSGVYFWRLLYQDRVLSMSKITLIK